MIRLQLPIPPSANKLWRVGKAGRVYKSPAYAAWLEEAGWHVAVARPQRIPGPYALSITASRPDARKRDLDNLLKATSDLLGRMRIVEDDCLCQRLSAEWIEDGEGMVLRLEPIDADSQAITGAVLGIGR